MSACGIPTDHRVKIKKSQNLKKWSDLARELNEMWNTKVTVISIIVGARGTIPKVQKKRLGELKLEIRGRIETVQATAPLRSAKYLKSRVDLLSLELQ